jgi:hypothetical protein
MKAFSKILLILVFFTIAAAAQEKTEPKKKEPVEKNEEMKTEENKKEDQGKEKFIDENGDGINDNQQGKGFKNRKGRNDKFVDNDGDGINDNRCQGMGWSKGKQKGHGKHPGK